MCCIAAKVLLPCMISQPSTLRLTRNEILSQIQSLLAVDGYDQPIQSLADSRLQYKIRLLKKDRKIAVNRGVNLKRL